MFMNSNWKPMNSRNSGNSGNFLPLTKTVSNKRIIMSMQLDKPPLAVETWKEIEDLERETKALLDTVRAKQPIRKKDDPKKDNKSAGKKKELANQNSGGPPQVAVQPPVIVNFQKAARSTLEILDDASPDATPRLQEGENSLVQKVHEQAAAKDRFARIEESYRKLLFEDESRRVAGQRDTFAIGSVSSADAVQREWQRLSTLEQRARMVTRRRMDESAIVSTQLHEDKAVRQIQRVFRGHVGRQRVRLLRQLSTVFGHADDWLEVKDADTGDVWFYNTRTEQSQWTRPDSMALLQKQPSADSKPTKKKQKKKPKAQSEVSLPPVTDVSTDGDVRKKKSRHQQQGFRTLTVSMSLPHLPKHGGQKPNLEDSALRSEIIRELGLDRVYRSNSASRASKGPSTSAATSAGPALLQPDGMFHRPQLRHVVLDALLETRFDTVSSVLADPRWFEQNDDVFHVQPQPSAAPSNAHKIDPNRTPLVSMFALKPSQTSTAEIDARLIKSPQKASQSDKVRSTADLTLRDVPHPGLDDSAQSQALALPQKIDDTMCFGCWSAGLGLQCSLHRDPSFKLNASQTMLLCRNWDLDVLRRKYRAEEIQEIFLKREASLRYDARRKAFHTVSEQRHPIYRFRAALLDRLNARHNLFCRIRFWMHSLAEYYRVGNMQKGDKDLDGDDLEAARAMRLKRGILHLSRISRFSKTVAAQLPQAPITGSSLAERRGLERFLFRRFDAACSNDVDVIVVEPIPQPRALYLPRHAHRCSPVTFPLGNHHTHGGSQEHQPRVAPANCFLPDLHPAGWLERLCGQQALDTLQTALAQVHSLTPVTPVDMQLRTKKPTPTTQKYATLGDKPAPDNHLVVGGLPRELLVFQLVSTYFPPQYGHFSVLDKASVSPGVTPEQSISFASLVMPPSLELFVERPLEHPLTHRRAPTIALHSAVQPQDKHFYGVNRPEQTGEQHGHGFRTTAWAPRLGIYSEIDAVSFTPGLSVASLNTPRANRSLVTAADATYPFCEPSTRDNSTLDFYHLLLAGICSVSQAQVFTALTVQEPGNFQKHYQLDLPLGHLLVAVYRSWAFTQRDTLQRFSTDDGVPYWYHRKTGQTFWERPLYEEEETSVLKGGVRLDMTHNEAPSIIAKNPHNAALQPRYHQGEVRDELLRHVTETKKEALTRRRAASVTVRHARERGLLSRGLGDSEDGASLENHVPQSNSSQLLAVGRTDFEDVRADPQHSLHAQDGTYMSQTLQQQSFHSADSDLRSFALDQPSQELMDMYQPTQVTSQALQFSQPVTAQPQPLVTASGMHAVPSHPQHRGLVSAQGAQGVQGVPQGGAAGFMDPNAMQFLSHSLGQIFSQIVLGALTQPGAGNAQQPGGLGADAWVNLGAHMGSALLQSGAPNMLAQQHVQQHLAPSQVLGGQLDAQTLEASAVLGDHVAHQGHFPALSEEHSESLSQGSQPQGRPSRVSSAQNAQGLGHGVPEPIGLAYPTQILSSDKTLDHGEEARQRQDLAQRFEQPLSTLEKARKLQILGSEAQGLTDTPDVRPPKVLTVSKPANAEAALLEEKVVPIVAYPELTSQPRTANYTGSAPPTYSRKGPAGEGSAYVSAAQAVTQKMVPQSGDVLARHAMPMPVGFFAAVEAKHVATQAADYLPQVPNLPQSRTIGRVRPRSAAADWLLISFDPWSAGRNPLSTEFVPSLLEKADKLLAQPGTKAVDTLDSLRAATVSGAFVNVVDEEGLAKQRQEVTKAQVLADDYKKLCSLCRHSKFADAEQLLSQPDWAVPIDYQDDQGNALLHVAAQNGSKRLVKLCLRKGADLNLQNLNGQTALHFAYGYGYSDVGDYLVSKGADDSIRNKDSLTCYEGLGARELTLL